MRTVVHAFTNADGTPASGTATFSLGSRMTNGGVTRLPGTVVATLDGTGLLSQALTANDDPDTYPAGVRWEVTLNIAGAEADTFSTVVPSTGTGNVDLGTLLPQSAQVS